MGQFHLRNSVWIMLNPIDCSIISVALSVSERLSTAWRWSLPLMFMQIRPKLPKLYPNSVKPPTTVNSEATTITSLQIFAKIFPNIFVFARTMVCPGANIFVPDKILLMNNCQIKVTRPIAQWLSDHKETFFLFSSQEPFAYWRLTGDSNIQMG